MKTTLLTFVAALLTAQAAAAPVLFDFDNAAPHQSLPLDLTVGGVTAHLSATGQGFSIQDTVQVIGVLPVGFSGLGITPNGVFPADLIVSFPTTTLTDFSIKFAPQDLNTDSSATLRITASLNGTLVGTNTAVTDYQGTWPSGTLTFSSPQTFNNLVIHYDRPPPTGGDYGVIFAADNMFVTPAAPVTLAGDFNQDGVVDAADYVVWRLGLGIDYTPADYDTWRAHFGQAIGSGGLMSSGAVPEPASWLFVVVALTTTLCLRRRSSPMIAAVAVCTMALPATAATTPTIGPGSAVSVADRFDNFDALDYNGRGTPLSDYQSNGLYVRTNGNSYYGDDFYGRIQPSLTYFNPFHLIGDVPVGYSYYPAGGGFYFPYDGDFGNTDWVSISATDAKRIYGVEFLYGNGWTTGAIYGPYPWGNDSAVLDWKTYNGNTLVSSGTFGPWAVGNVLGFSDPTGFDRLMIRCTHPNSGDPNLEELALDNLLVQLHPDLPGDFNRDGTVDAADYVTWRIGLDVDYTPADYDIWRANFGQAVALGGSLPTANSSVPEPASTLLFLVALLATPHRRRHNE